MASIPERLEAGDYSFLDGVGLLGAIAAQRWFGSKTRDAIDVHVQVGVAAPGGPPILALVLGEVRFGLSEHELYQLALGLRPAEEGWREQVYAEPGGWTVYEALADPQLVRKLVNLMRRGESLRTTDATAVFASRTGFSDRIGAVEHVRPMAAEQSNSSVVIDEALVLKLYRRLEPGVNPELELLRFLTEHGFERIPALEGWIVWEGRPMDTTLGLLQRFVPAYGDGWELTLDAFPRDPEWLPRRARRLGEVIGSLHSTLASDASDPGFAPEEPSSESVALIAASVDEEIESVFQSLPDDEALAPIAHRGEEVRDRLRLLTSVGPVGRLIRGHGDLHLGQVLWTHDHDWTVLDFEGEPARSVPERRRKRSPLRDVAGMLRSFAYAASAARIQRGVDAPAGWEERCRSEFLEGYRVAVDPSLLPPVEAGAERLLAVFELEKAVYELRYELDNRPEWVPIPVAGIQRILELE